MSWTKKHSQRKPYKKVININDTKSRYLTKGLFYGVLEEKAGKYLIQFSFHKGAKWYRTERFIDIPIKRDPPKPGSLLDLI